MVEANNQARSVERRRAETGSDAAYLDLLPAPEADTLEQQRAWGEDLPVEVVESRSEVPEADLLDQSRLVPLEEDDMP